MNKLPAIKCPAISINDIRNELSFICREMDVIIKLMPPSDNKKQFEQVEAMLRFVIYPKYGVNLHDYRKNVVIEDVPIGIRIYSIELSLCKFIWFVSQKDPRLAGWLKGVARGLGKEMDKLLSEDMSTLTAISSGQ